MRRSFQSAQGTTPLHASGRGSAGLGDQRRDRSLLSQCGFVHGMPVGEARSAGAPVPSLGGATNATPPRVELFASVPAGARSSLGRVAHRPWGLRHRSQPRSTSHQLAAGALAGLRRWRSNSGFPSVSAASSASARGVKIPPRSRELSVAPQVRRATMPLIQIGLWRGSVQRNGRPSLGAALSVFGLCGRKLLFDDRGATRC